MRGDGKRESDVHAAAVAFDGGVEEFIDFGKGDDFVELSFYFSALHAEDCAVQEDVFASGQFGMEAGANFQQTRHAPFDPDSAFGWFGDAAKYFQKSALTGPISSNDSDDLAGPNLKIH